MLVIAYYSNNKFQSIAGVDNIGIPCRQNDWNKRLTFHTKTEAEIWERKFRGLTGDDSYVILHENRAQHLLRFGC